MKESIQRAFAYIQGHKVNMGIAQTIDTTDFHVEAIDLLINQISCDAGIGLVVAIYSALKKHSSLARAADSGRSQHSRQHQSGALAG